MKTEQLYRTHTLLMWYLAVCVFLFYDGVHRYVIDDEKSIEKDVFHGNSFPVLWWVGHLTAGCVTLSQERVCHHHIILLFCNILYFQNRPLHSKEGDSRD